MISCFFNHFFVVVDLEVRLAYYFSESIIYDLNLLAETIRIWDEIYIAAATKQPKYIKKYAVPNILKVYMTNTFDFGLIWPHDKMPVVVLMVFGDIQALHLAFSKGLFLPKASKQLSDFEP